MDPAKTVNLGAAAHITAASPDGPRYDPKLTPEERCSPDNGIWLCQTDGKLVDNDEQRYPVETLRAWKKQAEEVAARELEQRLRRFPDRSAILARMERLMPALLAEMRQDLAQYPLRREFVILKRAWSYWASGNELFYYFDDHPDLVDMLNILENEALILDVTRTNAKRYRMTEDLADYLGAP